MKAKRLPKKEQSKEPNQSQGETKEHPIKINGIVYEWANIEINICGKVIGNITEIKYNK